MPYTAYPTADDVENWLRSTAFWPTEDAAILRAQSQAAIAAEAAKDEWERLTGWYPFLADGSASARTFDSTDQNGFLDFEGGAVSVSSISVNGTALVLGTSYWLEPQNPRGRPYTGINLGNYGYCGYGYWPHSRGSITVTARWGRGINIHADAWQGILQRASINTLRAIPNEQGLASISQDGFSKALDVVGVLTQKDIAQGGDKDFTVLAARYTRVVC